MRLACLHFSRACAACARSRLLAVLVACIALPGCTAAIYGHESVAAGATGTATASAVHLSSSGSNYAVAASFGRAVPTTVPGGQVVVSSGSASAVLLLGVVLINVLDHLGGGSAKAALKASGDRPIAHTCSCYGYRPEDDMPQASE